MRLAVFSDVHANLPALESVLRELKKKKIKQIYCAGDLVGDGPFPREVLELLRQHSVECIRGHSDLKLLRALEKRKRDRLTNWTLQQLTVRDLELLKSLSARQEIEIFGKKLVLVHGSPFSEIEYVTRNRDDRELEEMLSDAECQVLVCGHSHEPFVRSVKNGWVINCGAVGKHINGAGLAQYALLTIQNGKFRAAIQEVPYARERLLRAAVERNFPLEGESVITAQAGEEDSPEIFRDAVISSQLSLLRSFIKACQAAETELYPENVRHLRISARRLLHALRTFSGFFPKRRLHLSQLKKLRQVAGRLRELDILMGHLAGKEKQIKKPQSGGIAALQDELARRLEEARRELAALLMQLHRNSVLDSLHETLSYDARSRLRKENGVDPSQGTRANFYRLLKRTARDAASLVEEARNPLRRDELHWLRIACKKLRYTLEFFQWVSSYDYKAQVETLKNFQKLMGQIHDLDTSTDLINDLSHALKRQPGAAAGRAADYLALDFQRERMRLFETFLEASYDFEKSNFFQSLVPDGSRA